MNKKIIYLSFLFVIIFGCNNDDSRYLKPIKPGGFLDFTVKNAQGEDLLDPSVGGIDVDGIKIFHQIGNEMVEFKNPPWSGERIHHGYNVTPSQKDDLDVYLVGFFLNAKYILRDNISYMQIKWSPEISDTIKTEFIKVGEHNFLVRKLWINGQLRWDKESPTSREELLGYETILRNKELIIPILIELVK